MPNTRTLSQASELARRVRERIQLERLEDGAFFMTEAQLAEEYGVSRTVTREAVSRLQALGILEGRKRKGLVVRHPDPLSLLSKSLPSLVSCPDNLRDIALLRYAVEVGAIELAVRAATDAQIERLGEIVSEMEMFLRADPDSPTVIDLDLRFHAQILTMTGSKLIAGLQQVLVQFFTLVQHPSIAPADAERMCWEHRELYRAIRDRDVERARAMIRLQFRSSLIEPPAAATAGPLSGGPLADSRTSANSHPTDSLPSGTP